MELLILRSFLRLTLSYANQGRENIVFANKGAWSWSPRKKLPCKGRTRYSLPATVNTPSSLALDGLNILWTLYIMMTYFFFFFWEGERVVGEERCRPGSFQWKRGERNHLGYSDLTWPRVCIPKKLTGDVASAGPWTALGVARFWPVNSKCGLL